MTLTSKKVQGDIYHFLKGSTLSRIIGGNVYRNGTRPRDSQAEDAVVTFVTGLPGEIQTGVVVVNIYVKDIDPFCNGVLVEDSGRTEEIEAAAATWVESLTCALSDYKFSLAAAIQTFEESAINQHFVSVRLKYEYWNN